MLPLFDTESLGKFPFWVIVIILLNIYVFYLELTVPNPDAFIAQYALISSRVNFGNFATLVPFITSQFVHGGVLHIASNMLFLWVFGRNAEAKLGFAAFPIIYLLSGVLGGLAQYLTDPTSSVPMLGASGAIAGILGSYFAFFPHHRIKTLIFIFIFFTIVELPAAIILVYWFITQVLSIYASPVSQGGIAYAAHIAGFITGWVVAKVFYDRPSKGYTQLKLTSES